MFRLLYIFIVLGLGLFVGTQYADQQGYALISIANITIEMSVTTLVLIIVALLIVLFSLEFIIKRSLRATSNTWNWFNLRKLKRARRYTNEGIIKLLEGDWQTAEKKVTRWANHHDMPALCYLVAAEAAQGMGNTTKRDNYLQLASQKDQFSLAVKLTRAKQLVQNHEYSQAHQALEQLKGQYPNNPIVLGLLKTVYKKLGLWSQLDELLPKLNKHKVLSGDETEQLLHQSHAGILSSIADNQGIHELLAYWSRQNKKFKKDSHFIQVMIEQLIKLNGDSEAYIILREALKSTPNDELFALLTKLNLPDLHPATVLLEELVKKGQDNASAYSALGQLYLRQQKWPQAQAALEQALKKRNHLSDYALLANSLEKQDMQHAAGEVSRKALSLFKANQ